MFIKSFVCLSQQPRVDGICESHFLHCVTVMFNTVDYLDCRLFRDTKYLFLQKFLFVRYDKSAVLKVIYNIVVSYLFTHTQGGSLSGSV